MYNNIVQAIFIDRPNRFIANVLIDDRIESVHVRNTGRCKEILVEGTKVYLEVASNPNRKTKYSLVSAYKGDKLINIDSQIPNMVVYQGLVNGYIPELSNIDFIKREFTYGNSRFDIYFEIENKKALLEVKGVTLENEGVSMFPDAPTLRGTKHILEMIKAVKEGYLGYIFFLIQMEEINIFKPNVVMDKEFTKALKLAVENNVKILAYNSKVSRDSIELNEEITIIL